MCCWATWLHAQKINWEGRPGCETGPVQQTFSPFLLFPFRLDAAHNHKGNALSTVSVIWMIGWEIRKMELRNVVKDKKFWFASFLVAWAAALQGHMMWLQRQDSFKHKFGTLHNDHNQDQDQLHTDHPQNWNSVLSLSYYLHRPISSFFVS